MKDRVLVADRKVDEIRRLHQKPPVEWTGRTAWTVHTGPNGGKVLFESAFINCPDCGENAIWRNGQMRCTECGKRRLIG